MSWKQLTSHGYTWVPSVYFLEGLPFAVATSVSIVMFKSFGMSNGSIAFWTSVIAFPWSLKFLWAPFLDSVGTKRGWMLFSQYLLAASLGFLAVFA